MLNPTLYPKEKLSYDPEKDMHPNYRAGAHQPGDHRQQGLAANNSKRPIDLAKKKPGEITYGTAGVGSAPHMNMVKFQDMAKVKLQAVHYRGAAPASTTFLQATST